MPLAFALDALIGDPRSPFHPVCLIGLAVEKGEKLLRRGPASPAQDLFLGFCLTVVVVSGAYLLTSRLLGLVERLSSWVGFLVSILLASLCLARRSLKEHALDILHPLVAGDLSQARTALTRIVSRETTHLREEEIVRATVESVAENTSDGMIAPLFYLALGGVPLAMAYKAVNTLDSMMGYHTERHEYFGKTAARLDDAANYIPARLTALALIGAAWVQGFLGREERLDWREALRVTRKDGRRHPSPNAGYPEAAMAGALGVQLGGMSRYFGAVVPKPTIGEGRYAPSPEMISRSLSLLDGASVLALFGFTAARSLWVG
ncbi:MAG: cobalamin biosynthesis protein CobD [Deltaproteobacteria bacterium]|nr:cobalamin biosynthesis protein CobD [Deltaproteobacteria bacterium]